MQEFYGTQETLYPVPCTLYPVPCTLYPIPCTLYPVPCTLYPVPCTLYPVPCTLVACTQETCTLYLGNPELHAMLCQLKCTQPTPLTQPAWNAYLNQHFRPSAARGVQPRGLGVGSGLLSARDMAVLLGRNHRPQEVLLQQGAQNEWMPAPDTIDPLEAVPCLPWWLSKQER